MVKPIHIARLTNILLLALAMLIVWQILLSYFLL
jgi:hypothetical protein